MSKTPKSVIEFGQILKYPLVYGQLIGMTVAIYKSELKKFSKNPKGMPRHPRTVLINAFRLAKIKLSDNDKFMIDGIPTKLGLKRSEEMMLEAIGFKSPVKNRLAQAQILYGVATNQYMDCQFKAIKDKHGKGSKNFKCMPREQLRKQLKSLRSAMDEVFKCDTAYGTCNNNSMASGHCMLASLIVQDLYGGDIKGGEVDGIPHYWNRVCQFDVDLTGDQFLKPPIQISKKRLYAKDSYVFSRDPFESMNQDFNMDMWKKHCTFRKRVIAELKDTDPKLAKKLQKSTDRLK